MEFLNYEERFFWKKIYNSCIHGGRSAVTAIWEADRAVETLRERPVVRRGLTKS